MQKPILLLLLAAVVLFPCAGFATPASGVSTDAKALLAFKAKADPGNRLAFPPVARNSSSTGHCSWPGVECSSSGRVVRFVLEGAGLTGSIAAGTLDRLDQLRILSLKGNSLAGPIPDLSPLINLKALFLGGNRLGGPFPASILSFHRLRTLDLSSNHLAGPVPPELADLDRLNALRLERNRFNGPIPTFNQSSLKNFNVSYNNFSGAIPATAALSSFDATAFAGNPGLCGEAIGKECGSHFLFFHGGGGSNGTRVAPSPASAIAGSRGGILLPGSAASSPSQRIHKRAIVVIGFLAGSLLVIGVLGAFLVMQKRRRMKQGEILSPVKHNANGSTDVAEPNLDTYNEEIESGNNELIAAAALAMSEEKVKKLAKSGCLVFCAGEAQVYTLEQLMKSSAEMLGRGTLGTTYKAVLENRLVVTVKRLDAGKLAATGKESFERHMEVVGRLRHPNLVPLRAYFQAKEERLLVYDYQPNGSLHSLIHDEFGS
ncbi:putative inactive receptor kinase [Canna indica]|uniref:Inactive receptor kinase n=1 Tax=Canna indica TaxID=4628 RepID=A0AAQ3L587_9LILI|nr:putative inactive receptor kinase [Canna indica]